MLCSKTVINAQNRTTNFADVLINEIGVDRVALGLAYSGTIYCYRIRVYQDKFPISLFCCQYHALAFNAPHFSWGQVRNNDDLLVQQVFRVKMLGNARNNCPGFESKVNL